MNKNPVVLLLSASLLAGTAFAGAMGPVTQQPEWTWLEPDLAREEQPHWTWVGTLSAGPVWEREKTAQTLYLAPNIEKTYKANQSTNALFEGEVFIGLQRSLVLNLLGQLGLAVSASSNANLLGMIWDDANPQFANYTYNYKIQHTYVAVKGKLLADKGYWVIPWISGSLGVGFNDAHSFINIPTIFEALPNPNFTPHKETSFTYTLGAGVQKALNNHWQVGVGYEFADWGATQLGRVAGQTLNNGLSLNHLYTNGILFNLTYIA